MTLLKNSHFCSLFITFCSKYLLRSFYFQPICAHRSKMNLFLTSYSLILFFIHFVFWLRSMVYLHFRLLLIGEYFCHFVTCFPCLMNTLLLIPVLQLPLCSVDIFQNKFCFPSHFNLCILYTFWMSKKLYITV